jgi:ComF family protein
MLDLHYPCVGCLKGIQAYGRYEPPLSTLIKRYKFGSEKKLAKVLAPLYHSMLQNLGNVVLIPIPASRKGFHDRGFDQMATLCKVLKKNYGYPVLHVLVGKGKGEQKFLTSEQRKQRIGYAVEKRQSAVIEKCKLQSYTFVMIDDISTTGRTLEQCSELLNQSFGVQSVSIVLALA